MAAAGPAARPSTASAAVGSAAAAPPAGVATGAGAAAPAGGGSVEAYRGSAVVVHGHLPVRTPTWRRRTIDIDTGCVYGGRLTALRWPERALVSVPAARAHAPRPDRSRR